MCGKRYEIIGFNNVVKDESLRFIVRDTLSTTTKYEIFEIGLSEGDEWHNGYIVYNKTECECDPDFASILVIPKNKTSIDYLEEIGDTCLIIIDETGDAYYPEDHFNVREDQVEWVHILADAIMNSSGDELKHIVDNLYIETATALVAVDNRVIAKLPVEFQLRCL